MGPVDGGEMTPEEAAGFSKLVVDLLKVTTDFVGPPGEGASGRKRTIAMMAAAVVVGGWISRFSERSRGPAFNCAIRCMEKEMANLKDPG